MFPCYDPDIKSVGKTYTKLPSIPQYRVGVIRFNEWLGNRPITEEAIRKYFQFLRKNASPSTIRLAKTAIKAWILKNHSERNSVLFRTGLESVFKEIKIPKPSTSLSDSKFLNIEEIQTLSSQLPLKYSLILQALYMTGCRISELLSVRLKDFKKLRTHVEGKVVGKGGKEYSITISLPLFREIQKEFSGRTYLFENFITGRAITRQLVHRNFQRVGQLILERNIHPHQIRHSRISHLLKAGKPLDAVSRFANHHEPGFTARVYGHNRLTIDEILDSTLYPI